MALLLFRLGTYVLLGVLALWVLRDNLLKDFAQTLNDHLLNSIGLGGLGCLALGVVALIYEKLTAGRRRTRCKICRKPVIAGEFYCREHQREIVDRGRNNWTEARRVTRGLVLLLYAAWAGAAEPGAGTVTSALRE